MYVREDWMSRRGRTTKRQANDEPAQNTATAVDAEGLTELDMSLYVVPCPLLTFTLHAIHQICCVARHFHYS